MENLDVYFFVLIAALGIPAMAALFAMSARRTEVIGSIVLSGVISFLVVLLASLVTAYELPRYLHTVPTSGELITLSFTYFAAPAFFIGILLQAYRLRRKDR